MRFRRSRYAYWWQYALVIMLAFAWMYLRDRGSDTVALICGIGAAIGFIALELLIQLNHATVSKGVLDIHQPGSEPKAIQLSAIKDVRVDQGAWGKMFRFGYVHLMTDDGDVVLRFVHEPSRLVRVLRRK